MLAGRYRRARRERLRIQLQRFCCFRGVPVVRGGTSYPGGVPVVRGGVPVVRGVLTIWGPEQVRALEYGLIRTVMNQNRPELELVRADTGKTKTEPARAVCIL